MVAIVKILQIYLLRVAIRFLHIFPINTHRVIMNSYRGSQYSCNPKYISEYLEKTRKLEIIWAFNEPEDFVFLKERGIKTVKYSSIKRFYYEATAKVSINNVGSFSWIPLRKKQEHINTWHAGGSYKKTGLDEAENSLLMKKTIEMTANETTLFLSSSHYFSTVSIPHNLGYNGKILDCGLPRNDNIVKGSGTEITNKVRKYFHISKELFILLCAPTWRYNDNKIPVIDFEKVRFSIRKRFGKDCVILYRAHHITGGTAEGNIVNATDYPDMQELLISADMLITDYSSCIWDYSFTYRPCFLYTPDLDDYIQKRGFNMDIYEWHFPICKTNTELARAIEDYDEVHHKENMDKHHMDLGACETGRACEIIGNQILEWCK